MKTTPLTILLLAFIVFFWISCTSQTPPFEFTAHHLKIQIDPDQQQLFTVDTVSIRYFKNTDHIYFFLHDSLQVSHVGIGNQSFTIDEISTREAQNLFSKLAPSDQAYLEKAQIVKVHIPKSLYAEKLEIRYSGVIDFKQNEPLIWYPLLPNVAATYDVTAVVPARFRLSLPGVCTEERADELWRFYRWQVKEPATECALSLVEIPS
jgi:hypothetical protein